MRTPCAAWQRNGVLPARHGGQMTMSFLYPSEAQPPTDSLAPTRGRPQGLERAIISLILKGEGAGPLDLRPISVMSAVCRLWAASRLADVKRWQEQWAHSGQHGFRAGHSTEDVYWAFALKVEHALLTGEALCGMTLDFSKCH